MHKLFETPTRGLKFFWNSIFKSQWLWRNCDDLSEGKPFSRVEGEVLFIYRYIHINSYCHIIFFIRNWYNIEGRHWFWFIIWSKISMVFCQWMAIDLVHPFQNRAQSWVFFLFDQFHHWVSFIAWCLTHLMFVHGYR